MTKFKKDAPVFQVEGLEPYTLPGDGKGGYLRICPDPSCPAHHRFFAPYWRLNEHMKTDHGWPRKSLQPSLDRRKNGRMRHPRSKTNPDDLLAGPAPDAELDDLPSKSAEYRAAHPKKRRRATGSTVELDLGEEHSALLVEGSEPPADDDSLPVNGSAPVEDISSPDPKGEASSEEPLAPPPPKRRRANPKSSVAKARASRAVSRPHPPVDQEVTRPTMEQPVQGSVLSLLTKQMSPPSSLPLNEPSNTTTSIIQAAAPYTIAPVPSIEPVNHATSVPLYPFRDLPVAQIDGTNSQDMEVTTAEDSIEKIIDKTPISEPPVTRTPVKRNVAPKSQVNIVIDPSINRTDDAMRAIISDFISSLEGSTMGQEPPLVLTRLRQMLDNDTVRVNRVMSASDAKDVASLYVQVAQHAKLKHDSIEASSKSSSLAAEKPRPTKYDQMPPIHTFKTAPPARKQHPLSSVSYPGNNEDNAEPVNGFYTFSAKPQAEQMDWSPTGSASRKPLKIRLNMAS